MKLFKMTILFGGLLALAASLSAESRLLQVDVPFPFLAGQTAMPAGAYTIEEPSVPGVLLLRATNTNASAMLLAVNGGPSTAAHAKVTFKRRNGSVVLSGVTVPGGSNYTLFASQNKTAAAVNVALPRK
jgi:hypothetical protein